ncbi:MAG: hypothetical protein R3263_00975 [Myxococcota bacterium]|nr:hypothetical protein [Myxococcota bacterium]
MRAAALGLALAAAWPGTGPAEAWIPPVERVARAAARANDAAGRDRPLRLEVAVWPEEVGPGGPAPPEVRAPAGMPSAPAPAAPEGPLATGTLLADPDGRARLELVHREGFRERHLLRGTALRATRDGAPLPDPTPLLPPLGPLQADSGGELLGWLTLHGAPREAELGHEGPHDAVVLGGRGGGAAIWVDQEDWSVVRVDRADGVRFHFGPPEDFGGVRLPGWIDVEAPGRPPLRLEVQAAEPVTPPPGAFSPAWLEPPPPAPPSRPVAPPPSSGPGTGAPDARPPPPAR